MHISKEGFQKFSRLPSVLEYKTLMCLMSHAKEDGTSYIKQEEIANMLNTTRQAVNRAIKELTKEDIISIERSGTRRIYHFNPDYCITNLGYKELNKKFNKFKIMNGGKNGEQ